MNYRDFLYLDRDLVINFLAQAEGGITEQTTETQTTTGKGGFGGKIGAGPVGVSAEKGKESALQTQAVIRQVAASEFDRLYRYLEEDALTIIDHAVDATVVDGIRRKQFLEVDARLQVSGLHQLVGLLSTMGAIAPLIEQFSDDEFDKETLAGIQTVSSLTGDNKSLALIATVPGAANLKVGLELSPSAILTDSWDTEASVLLKVQRVIKGSDRYLVGDPFGGLLKMIPPKERDKLAKSFDPDELAQLGVTDIEIAAPAIVGTPIAIYR
jgi:hypothetical protein